MSWRTLEVCVDNHEGLVAAIKGGADRIELCAALALGGLTPSEALMLAGARSPVPVYAMIRPRAGLFDFDEAELSDMEREIDRARAHGLAGVVLGAGGPDGLDLTALARLSRRAEGMGRTLHRVIDLVQQPEMRMADIAALGFERVLTSGGALTAEAGAETIAAMVRAAPKGLSVMAGSGVNASNAASILRRTGVLELHSPASVTTAPPDPRIVELGFTPETSRRTDPAAVAELAALLHAS